MQDDFDPSHIAQARHVRVSRDYDAPGVQPIGCSQHVLDKRHAAELGYKLVRSEAGARARCHDDASVLCLRSVSGVGHDGACLCKFDGWSGVFWGIAPGPQYNSADCVNLK